MHRPDRVRAKKRTGGTYDDDAIFLSLFLRGTTRELRQTPIVLAVNVPVKVALFYVFIGALKHANCCGDDDAYTYKYEGRRSELWR